MNIYTSKFSSALKSSFYSIHWTFVWHGLYALRHLVVTMFCGGMLVPQFNVLSTEGNNWEFIRKFTISGQTCEVLNVYKIGPKLVNI